MSEEFAYIEYGNVYSLKEWPRPKKEDEEP